MSGIEQVDLEKAGEIERELDKLGYRRLHVCIAAQTLRITPAAMSASIFSTPAARLRDDCWPVPQSCTHGSAICG